MRLSADDGSPFYDPDRSPNARVELNGENLEQVVEGSEEEGWVDVIDLPASYMAGEIVLERRHGTVKFIFPDSGA